MMNRKLLDQAVDEVARMRETLCSLLLDYLVESLRESDGDPGFDGQITMAQDIVTRCVSALGVEAGYNAAIDNWRQRHAAAKRLLKAEGIRDSDNWDAYKTGLAGADAKLQAEMRRVLGVKAKDGAP